MINQSPRTRRAKKATVGEEEEAGDEAVVEVEEGVEDLEAGGEAAGDFERMQDRSSASFSCHGRHPSEYKLESYITTSLEESDIQLALLRGGTSSKSSALIFRETCGTQSTTTTIEVQGCLRTCRSTGGERPFKSRL
jgi:hypothetical protein